MRGGRWVNVQVIGIAGGDVVLVALAVVVRHVVLEIGIESSFLVGFRTAVGIDVGGNVSMISVTDD